MSRAEQHRTVLWAIAGTWDNGNRYLYVGTAYTRTAMIQRHCDEKGRPWAACRKAGDRAVKIVATWTYR